MKRLVALSVLLLPFLVVAQDVTVIQINAKWNKENTVEELRQLTNCEYVMGWLEDQPHEIVKSISSVPVVVVYDGSTPVMQYAAGINLKLNITFDEVQSLVNILATKD